MPTRQVESEHDKVRHSSTEDKRATEDEVRQSSTEDKRATAKAEPNHPIPAQGAAGPESPSGDQDIDTAGTEADELSASRAALGFPRSKSSPPYLGPERRRQPGQST